MVHEEPRRFATIRTGESFSMIILCLINQSSVIGNLRSFSLTFSRQGIGDPGADKGSPEAGDGSGPQGGKLRLSPMM